MNDLNDALTLLGQKTLEAARLNVVIQNQAAQLKAAEKRIAELEEMDTAPPAKPAKKK